MYYALTINADQIITGIHESVTPILTDTFAANPELADDTVVTIPAPVDYQTYTHILCYNEDGTRKPDLWCIENGYMELPPDKEIINGELVDMNTPIENIPPTLMEKITEAQNANMNATAAVEELRAENQSLRQLMEHQMGKMLNLENTLTEISTTLPYINIRGEE